MSDRPGSVALGTNVRALRSSRGLTQVELAAKAGITKSYLSRIETGSRPANPELLERLADALDVDLGTLDESTVLETRMTAWRIEYAEGGSPETWEPYGPDSDLPFREHYEALRVRHPDVQWRAVRVETIETVEVW